MKVQNELDLVKIELQEREDELTQVTTASEQKLLK